MRSRASTSTWRAVLLALAVGVVVFELVTAAWRTKTVTSIGVKNARVPAMPVRDADLDLFSYYAPTLSMVAVQHAIPRDAVYTIVVGKERKPMPPDLAINVYRLWLMPRTYTPDLDKAQWVVTYFKASENLGRAYTDEIGLGPGVNAVKLTPLPAGKRS